MKIQNRKMTPTQKASGNFGSAIARTMANKARKIENAEDEAEDQQTGPGQEAPKAELTEMVKGKGSIASRVMAFKQVQILKNEAK